MTPNNQLAEPVAERAEMLTAKDQGRRFTLTGVISYPGSRISDVMLDGYDGIVQIPSEAIRAALASPAAISGEGSGAVAWGDSGPIPGHHFGNEFDGPTDEGEPVAWTKPGHLNLGSGYQFLATKDATSSSDVPLFTRPSRADAATLRQIVFDALDLSDELRSECADAVVAALTGSSHP